MHPTAKVSEQVNSKCPPWNTITMTMTDKTFNPYTDPTTSKVKKVKGLDINFYSASA